MSSVTTTLRHRQADVGFLLGLIVLGGTLGVIGTRHASLGIALAFAAALAGLAAVRPVFAAVLTLPALYGFQNIGLGGGLGISDVVLASAALLALPALAQSQELHELKAFNRSFSLYLVLLLPTLVVNFSANAAREVVHRVLLVTGAALVGAWLVREQAVVPALRLLVGASFLMALAAMQKAVRTGFAPSEPFGYNKNYIGSLLALTLLILLCAPDHVRLPAPVRLLVLAALVPGTLACQSRGAILGAALGGLLWLFSPGQRGSGEGRNRVAALVLATSFAIYTGYSVQQQLTSANLKTNSAGVRLDVERFTRDLWRTSPVVGIGIRYFATGNYGFLGINPNNAFDAELAESGVVGATGFALLQGTVLTALWRRRRSQLGIAALAVVAGNFLHGQFDNYWSSGITPLAFLLAGMAYAASARADRAR